MADPASYVGTKVAAMIGGFLGGAAILTFIRPKTIGEAFTRGGVSVGSAIIFSGPLIKYLEMSADWDGQLMSGFCIGFVAYSVLGMIANFLSKHKDATIVEAAGNIKDTFNKPKN